MARTAAETAEILQELYSETFANDSYEKFRITWSQLRLLSGKPRLTDSYLMYVNQVLEESGYILVPPMSNHRHIAQNIRGFHRLEFCRRNSSDPGIVFRRL